MKNKIKIMLAACVGSIMLLSGALTIWASGLLTIAVSSGSAKIGNVVTLTVYAHDTNNVDISSDMNITYDSSKLEYVSCSGANVTVGGGSIKATGSSVDVKLKAISAGDAYVKAEGTDMVAAGTHIIVSSAADTTTAATTTTTTTTTTSEDHEDDLETDRIEESDDSEQESQTEVTEASGDNIVINGIRYKISEDFTEEDIPEGFSTAQFEYKGLPYKGLMFDFGHLGLYYLVNEEEEGRFFVYDADRDGFYPYIRLSSGEHFIILMVVPNGAIPPDDYEPATLTLDEFTSVSAYQYAGAKDAEIVDFALSGEDASHNSGISDFYIFYAMDDTGTAGWYQYDIQQGTYQRLNGEAILEEDDGRNYDALLSSYNDLSDRHKATKTSDRRIIIILVFLSVVFFILIINLLLKVRELKNETYEDDEEYEDEEYEEEVQKPVKAKREKKLKDEYTEKQSYHHIEKEDTVFEEDASIMDEFEENPSVLGRRKKKEKPVKSYREEEKRKEYNEPIADEEDDDIEFLDLNDL